MANLVIDQNNSSSDRTKLSKNGNGLPLPAFEVENDLGAGILGRSKSLNGVGVRGQGSDGTGVSGSSKRGIGVRGETEAPDPRVIPVSTAPPPAPPTPLAGVHGMASKGWGVYGISYDGTGVQGDSTRGVGVRGVSKTFGGVEGEADGSPGVRGRSRTGAGVLGESDGSFGVHGVSKTRPGIRGVTDAGVAIDGESRDATVNAKGVFGYSTAGVGTEGNSDTGQGLFGSSGTDAAVYGITQGTAVRATGVTGVANATQGQAIGVYGASFSPAGHAGFFLGRVSIWGDLAVVGAKSAVVPHPDGSHRLLYAVESPESWFEDFGSARLVRGRATVKLEKTFAALVRADAYRVFLTPEGDCQGLYVARKRRGGFDVRECGGGRGSLAFSYRVVARRRDIAGPRLARVRLPKRPQLLAVRSVGAPRRAARTKKRR